MLSHSSLRLATLLGALALLEAADLDAAAALPEPSAPVAAPASDASPIGTLGELPEPLVPRRGRTAAEQDRLDALALFAAGRVHERRQELEAALRSYQRSLRLDPGAMTVARQVVRVAVRLKRPAVAVRYAALAAELDDEPSDESLRKLAAYFAGEGDLPRAVGLLKRIVRARSGMETKTADDLLLHVDLGRYQYLQGDYRQAAEQFALVQQGLRHPEEFNLEARQVGAVLQKPGAMLNLFGEAFLLADRTDDAVAAFDEAHRLEPNAPLRAYYMARVARKRGQPQEALQTLQAYFDARAVAEGTAAYRLADELLAELGRAEEATEYFARLHAADPNNALLGYFLADRCFEQKKYDQAEPLYASLTAERPTAVGFARLATIYHDTHQPEKLLAALGRVAAETSSLQPLGHDLAKLAADTATCDAIVAAARGQLDGDAASLDFGQRFAVALLALEAKRAELAAEFFERALAVGADKKAELLLVWGGGLMADDLADQAADVFRRGAEDEQLAGERASFYHYLAIALEAAGRTDDALAAASKAVELVPDDPRYLSRVAWVFYHARRNGEAREAYLRVLERFDSQHDSPAVRAAMRDARLALSNLCVILGHSAEGEEWLEQVLDEFPEDPSALNDLGYVWAEQRKHLHRALRMLEKAVASDPENLAYRDSLGWAYYQSGRYDEALVEIRKAAESETPDAVILDHLGDVYHQLGSTDEARSAWRRAAEAFRSDGDSPKAAAVEAKFKTP